jgi:hypothetical protein
MSFLTPWFLLGAAAIAGPILFHLIRQSVRERRLFSSLMFLRPTTQRVTRRRKLEDLLLLLLRCLCLVLLATGFARPFFTRNDAPPASTTQGRQLILLLDTSASMQREGLWGKARAIAEKYLAQTAPGDQVAVLTFDWQPRPLVNFAEWSSWALVQRAALARQRLAAVSPGWMGTQLGLALTGAAEKFTDDSLNGQPASRRELVLITDLQEGAKLDGLQGHDWPTGVQVILERVEAKPQANAGLEIQSPAGDDSPVRVRVTNARDSDRAKFQLAWQLPQGTTSTSGTKAMEIYLPPGQTRTYSAPTLPAGVTTAELRLSGDEVNFDNRSYFALPEAEHLTIAWFGSDAGNNPQSMRYYLQRVFPETKTRHVKVISPVVQQAFAPELLNQATFAVIPGRLAPEEITATHDWLARGRLALFIVTDVQSSSALAGLTGFPTFQVTESASHYAAPRLLTSSPTNTALHITEAAGDYALLGNIDFTHPLFAPFADPRFSDFTHIHFWKHRRLEFPSSAQARMLAKFDDGAPALAQIPVGQGNLLVLAAGWNPGDSELALSSKFPPLLQAMLEWSGGGAPARTQFETGDSIPSPASSGTAAVQWEKPDGKKVTLAAGAAFDETDLPGVYTATLGAPASGTARPNSPADVPRIDKPTLVDHRRQYAVNLPLDESRTATMSPDELSRLGVPLQTTSPVSVAQARQMQIHLQRAELENRQKLWRWLIVGVLAVMFGEILLSGWLARRPITTATSS